VTLAAANRFNLGLLTRTLDWQQQRHNPTHQQQTQGDHLVEDKTQIYQMLMEIKGSTEGTNALLKSHIENYNRHVLDTATEIVKTNNRVSTLEASQQRQAGFIAGVVAICTAIGSAIAIGVTWLFRGQ